MSPQPGNWYLIPNFDIDSREQFCSMSGSTKRKSDPGVWRGSYIDMEGYFDISHTSARQLARELGYVTPETNEKNREEIKALRSEVEALNEIIESLTQELLDGRELTDFVAQLVADATGGGGE